MDEKNDVFCYCPCKAKVIDNETLSECNGWRVEPQGVNGPLVAKIPVVLAEKKIQIDVESKLKLEDKVYEIKRIKKRLFITQCELLAGGERKDSASRIGKLFIAGFVRKNIEYATVKCIGEDKNVVSGDIKYTDFDVHFKCASEIEFDRQPIIFATTPEKEILLSPECKCDCDPCKDEIIGNTSCQQQFEHVLKFVEKPFCEIEKAEILEMDIHDGYKPFDYGSVKCFDKIIEKMVINITLKVLQKQQVNILGKCDGAL